MEFKVLEKRVNEILTGFDKEKYPNALVTLERVAEGQYYGDVYDFAVDIIDCDKTLALEPNVSKLVKEILLDEINENNHDASCDLGALYYTGRIGEQNYEKAVYYYEKSAKLGNRQAIENLGYCYYYGRYVEVDYKKAYHYFVKGALDGYLVSLYKIGDMYKNGLYVEKDERQAYYIYRRCSELLTDEQEEIFGADIYIRLADCYYYEVGVEKNLGVSLYCYQKAEQLYYPRIVGGDFAYKKQYERAIKMQRIIREEREKEIPNFDWN